MRAFLIDRGLFALAAAVCLCVAGINHAPAAPPAEASAIDFLADVRPILAANCYDCHAGDAREGGLRLDRGRDALAGGDSGRVIIPGDPEASRLLHLVSGDDPESTMPPDSEGLADDDVAVLRRWIEQGAEWPASADAANEIEHWSFRPIVRRDPPALIDETRVRNDIDRFVQARLAEDGIAPSAQADDYTLIKRLYYDLLGLPPDPERVDRFVADRSAEKYDSLVDELLDSPHFGERWGRHWLDTARYADSDGYEKDNPRYNAWKYRDWVINAINDDLPFDQFTIQQLAGDLLPDATQEQLVATGFNRQTLTNTEGGTDQEQFRVEAVFDRTETFGTAWLGLTVGCARCHTHKYDPITQREYYRLFAFFNNGDEANQTVVSNEKALEEYEQQQTQFDAELAELQAPLTARRDELAALLPAWEAEQLARLAAFSAHPQQFHPLLDATVTSEQGAELSRQEDVSWLASGPRPTTDVYVVESRIESLALTALRLEVLADAALPGGGPGRADHGNFVLSEITATVRPADDAAAEPQPVKFNSARSDYSQNEFTPDNAIDGKEDSTGWAVAGQLARDHHAHFFIAPESAAQIAAMNGPLTLTVRLSQQYTANPHTIGKFRLSAVTGDDPTSLGIPDDVRNALAVAANERTADQAALLLNHFTSLDADYQSLQAKVDEFRKQAPFKPEMTVPVIRERTNDRRVTRMLKRGEFLDPLEPVEPGTLDVLHELSLRGVTEGGDRLDLALWVVSPDNPLTPRVAVNHVWQHLFGRGLVETANDFGTRGDAPSHPELLDWLADEFIRLGWSRKQLIRTIVLSHTYRQSSAHRPELADADPENVLLYRQNRFRVEAEIVRDLHLAASGLLEPRIGGPSVFPPLPPGIEELSYANNFKWGNSEWNTRPDRPFETPPKEDVHRRGMYTFFKRTAPHPNLTTFDCPDANVTAVSRSTSNTPLQALITLNNDTYVETARGLTRRALTEVNTNDAERIARMVRLCIARPPSDAEVSAFLDLLNTSRDYYRAHAEEAIAFAGKDLPAETTAPEAAAWTATARIIMNLDEFITRE